MPAAKTIRQQLIDALYAKIGECKDPDNADGLVWNLVTRNNLDDVEVTQMPAVGIEEGEEEVFDQMWPVLHKRLPVFIEFRFQNEYGVDVYDKFNYYLGVLQRTLLPEKNLGGIAYDLQERGNAPRIVDKNDNFPGGVLILELLYKVRNDDPYTKLNK
jgi:hypothetical protein